MGRETDIAYADSTINPVVGCMGCELHSKSAPDESTCYAAALCARWKGNPGFPESFDQPKHFPGRIEKALKWPDLTGTKREGKPWLDGYPRVIFVNDLSDGFNSIDPEIWLTPHVADMADSKHIWLFCTKRPDNMLAYFHYHQPVPSNFWLMTTVTSQVTMWRADALCDIVGVTRLLSLEPLLGPVDLMPVLSSEWIHGVFIGGASGAKAQPCDLAWIRSAVEQCREAGVPCLVKQLGSRPFYRETYPNGNSKGVRVEPVLQDSKGGDIAEWPEDLRGVREMPRV